MKKEKKTSILFVCLGNICRSPMAEAIMQKRVEEAGVRNLFHIDSAGLISYHEGEGADPRMKSHAFRHGYRLTHISRPVRPSDFDDFDLIIGMDDSNYDKLRRLAPTLEAEAKVQRMTDYCTQHVIDHVPDPYYGGAQGFENVIEILEDACAGLLTSLQSPQSQY
ncbi:MAG: low molecular weight phosphotyrosine protein phosphatase [Bacteroidaceae bacterium]|nr:low molecular weight phosphotyrosine protein phosphatase [Bacteroidaceae bacterium]